MRTALRIVFVAAFAGATVGLAAVPSGAGTSVANTVTIGKEVVGTAPAGTTFTVQVDCTPSANPIPTVTFDATGNATSSAVFHPGPTSTCTVTETATGGASAVGYACVSAGTPANGSDPDGSLVDCTSDNVVHFTDVIGDSATITVTNTFTPAPTTTTQPAATPAAQAVQAAPTFTG
jgi:hypothetical protein